MMNLAHMKTMGFHARLSLMLSITLLSLAASAATLPVAKLDRKTPVDFHEEIVPILKTNCTACHNKTTTKADLNIETPALMLKGGESGPAIVPGKASESLLFQSAIHESDSEMPPKGNKVGAVNLSAEELALLKLWIDQGAKAGEKKAQEIAWQPLPPGLNPIYAVAMSPGGELVACSRANQIFIYDVAAKKLIAQFVAHRDMTLALAFSPDGSQLASGSFGEVKLWKTTVTPPPLSELVKLNRVSGIATLEAAFQTAAVAESDKEVTALKERVKKANEAIADTKKKLEEKNKAVKPAVDAKVAAQKAYDEAAAAVAKLPKDKPDAALTKKQTDAKTKLDAAVKTETDANDAAKAAETAAADAAAELPKVTKLQGDAEKAAVAAKAALAAAQAAQKNASADLAAATKAAKPVVVSPLPAQEWKLERTLGTGDTLSPITDRVNAIDFSPDGKTVAVGSGAPSRDGDITFWDSASGKLIKTISDRHSDTVLSLDYSPDGKLIASGGADKQLRISEIASGKLLKTFEGHTHHVMGVSWRADGRVVVSSGADNAVKVWDWIKGDRRKNIDGWDKEVTSVRYLGATTRIVTTSGDKQVRMIGEDASAPVLLPGTTDFMQTCDVSLDGDRVAAGGEDSVLRVWDVKTAKEIASFAKPAGETAAK